MRERSDRRALVTGAAAGLAAGIAATLPSQGFAHVAITYRTTPPDATLAAIRAAGATASGFAVDFLDEAERVEALLEEAVRRDGPFDTLVHAVGPLVVKRFAQATLEEYREAFDGNVLSAVLAMRATLPAMRAQRFGRIVLFGMIGSAHTHPFRSLSLYQAGKSALVALARSLALEEAPHGVTINVVAPGDIRKKELDRAQAMLQSAKNPRGRPGSYEDVADAVRFFVAQERDFVTGTV
ncbi:MAG TPA: SDR family oxidoreductase, partial [Candidatus Cybelea sp.]